MSGYPYNDEYEEADPQDLIAQAHAEVSAAYQPVVEHLAAQNQMLQGYLNAEAQTRNFNQAQQHAQMAEEAERLAAEQLGEPYMRRNKVALAEAIAGRPELLPNHVFDQGPQAIADQLVANAQLLYQERLQRERREAEVYAKESNREMREAYDRAHPWTSMRNNDRQRLLDDVRGE